MIIEIRGTGVENKGAELMTHAILQHFQQRNFGAPVEFAVTPKFGKYSDRARFGIHTKLSNSGFGRSRIIELIMSRSYAVTHGLVREKEIDVVLDASGFAYSDQWGPEPAEQLVKLIRKRKHLYNSKVILLPQSFGPFTSERIKKAFIEIQENSQLIFAREKESYTYIKSLGGSLENVRIAPDFTNMVQGFIPPYWRANSSNVLIIPNTRMIDMTNTQESQNYVSFLHNCINETTKRGFQPTILLHSSEDNNVIKKLKVQNAELAVVYESDPLNIKGIIGTASFIIASRFHALVSALSQGVPAVGTGWSHKYQFLFKDYGCPELLLSTQSSNTSISDAFDTLTENHLRIELIKKLSANGDKLKNAVYEMWNEVDSHICSVK